MWQNYEIDTLQILKGIIPGKGKSIFQICVENLDKPNKKIQLGPYYINVTTMLLLFHLDIIQIVQNQDN